MHIPDGFLDPKMSGGLLGMAAAALGFCMAKVMRGITAVLPERVWAVAGNGLKNIGLSGRRVLTRLGKEKLLRMGSVASVVFAFQTFNFPVGSGTSGHLIGGVFAAVLLGPYAGTVALSIVLAIQSLIFADGGLAALGGNIVNMAVIGSFGGYYLYDALRKWMPEKISVAAASWLSVVLASLACSFEIGLSGTTGLKAAAFSMVKIHALIGIGEAAITILLLEIFREKDPS
jgi:cobalt/nickel transport system permease protein